MKIRIKGNTLRYRITRSEVERLGAEGVLQEQTQFAGKTLFYTIEKTTNNKLTADFIDNRIVVFMPETMIKELLTTDRVGFEDKSGPVSILIEKDFVCIDRAEEDQSDNYPNPAMKC